MRGDGCGQLFDIGVTPGLAVILVGQDAASAVYVRNKVRACDAVEPVVLGVLGERHGAVGDRLEEQLELVQLVGPRACRLDVVEGGKTVRWQAELGSPQQLIKQFGWTPSTITSPGRCGSGRRVDIALAVVSSMPASDWPGERRPAPPPTPTVCELVELNSVYFD